MIGRVLLGLAAGSALVPLLAEATGTPVPCAGMAGCVQIALSGADRLFGLPLGLLVLLGAGACLVRTWGAWAGTSVAAVVLVAQSKGLLMGVVWSPWLLAAGVLLLFGSLLTFRRSEPGPLTGYAGLAALAVPFLVSPLLMPKVTERKKPGIDEVRRPFLTESQGRKAHETVLFGSPMCPACRKELLDVAAEGPKAGKLVFRYVPLRDDPLGRRAALGLRLAILEGRTAEWTAALAEGRNLGYPRMDPKALVGLSKRLDGDVGTARSLGIREVPVRLDCLPDAECRRRP